MLILLKRKQEENTIIILLVVVRYILWREKEVTNNHARHLVILTLRI